MHRPNKPELPTLNVLGNNSVTNHHLSGIVKEFVKQELEYWTHSLCSLGSLDSSNKLIEFHAITDKMRHRISALRDENAGGSFKMGGTELSIQPVKKERIPSDHLEMRHRIKSQLNEAVIICVSENNMGDACTCMFFPFQHGDTKIPGSKMTPEEVYACMIEIGGGIAKKVLHTEPDKVEHLKGWSQVYCRVCDANVGQTTMHFKKMLVPDGAEHYHKVHGLPMNLFSYPCANGMRIWYVAKKPYKHGAK